MSFARALFTSHSDEIAAAQAIDEAKRSDDRSPPAHWNIVNVELRAQPQQRVRQCPKLVPSRLNQRELRDTRGIRRWENHAHRPFLSIAAAAALCGKFHDPQGAARTRYAQPKTSAAPATRRRVSHKERPVGRGRTLRSAAPLYL